MIVGQKPSCKVSFHPCWLKQNVQQDSVLNESQHKKRHVEAEEADRANLRRDGLQLFDCIISILVCLFCQSPSSTLRDFTGHFGLPKKKKKKKKKKEMAPKTVHHSYIRLVVLCWFLSHSRKWKPSGDHVLYLVHVCGMKKICTLLNVGNTCHILVHCSPQHSNEFLIKLAVCSSMFYKLKKMGNIWTVCCPLSMVLGTKSAKVCINPLSAFFTTEFEMLWCNESTETCPPSSRCNLVLS